MKLTIKHYIFGLICLMSIQTSALASPTYFAAPSCTTCNIHVQNFGGPIMTGTTDIVNIFYGYSPGSITTTLENFILDLNGSSYLNIASVYGASTTLHETANIFEGTATYGLHLTDGNLVSLVDSAAASINGGVADPNAIYMIYTAANITETQSNVACGFHDSTVYDSTNLKYAWIGGGSYFNGNSGCGAGTLAQNITSTASHELFETLTDPLVALATTYGPPLGFYDAGPKNQGEIGDMCNQKSFLTNLNGSSYYVQSIWVNDPSYSAGGYCASGNAIAQTSMNPAPESAAIALIATGLLGFGALRKKKNQAVQLKLG